MASRLLFTFCIAFASFSLSWLTADCNLATVSFNSSFSLQNQIITKWIDSFQKWILYNFGYISLLYIIFNYTSEMFKSNSGFDFPLISLPATKIKSKYCALFAKKFQIHVQVYRDHYISYKKVFYMLSTTFYIEFITVI